MRSLTWRSLGSVYEYCSHAFWQFHLDVPSSRGDEQKSGGDSDSRRDREGFHEEAYRQKLTEEIIRVMIINASSTCDDAGGSQSKI